LIDPIPAQLLRPIVDRLSAIGKARGCPRFFTLPCVGEMVRQHEAVDGIELVDSDKTASVPGGQVDLYLRLSYYHRVLLGRVISTDHGHSASCHLCQQLRLVDVGTVGAALNGLQCHLLTCHAAPHGPRGGSHHE
jgi:hypothetical protein